MKDAKLIQPLVLEEETSGLRKFARFQTNVALMNMVANSLEPTSYKEAKEEKY